MTDFVTQLKETLKKSGMGGFLLAILIVIFLAWLQPSIGISDSPISLEKITSYGVSVIFFFYGLSLSLKKLKEGLSNWRMHIVVQLTTFLLFPLVILAIRPLFTGDGEAMWLGIFYLSALPSTVSSSVVMVSVAKGNIPAAIFNASISSLIGIFITPLWMGLFLDSSAGGFDVTSIMGKLVIQVLVPVIIGVSLNSRWGSFAEKNRSKLKLFDQSIILLIIYVSFCQSFYNRVFDQLSVPELTLLGAGMVVLFLFIFMLVSGLNRLLKFNKADRITLLFCGSKKSLVHGTVMSKVLFTPGASVGLVLLPLMLYHALQLILASIIAQKMNSQPTE